MMTQEPVVELDALNQLRSSFDATFGRRPENREEREAVIQVRVGSEEFAVRFENSLKARMATVRYIYSAIHQRAIQRVMAAPLAQALFRRLMR